jgi:histidinol-phosphate aminotransferase
MKPIDLALPGVKALTPYQPGKPISELERELGITNIVKLASNENPLGPSPKALEAIVAGLKDLHLYPDGSAFALRQALANHLNVSPNQITLGNGSNDVLEMVARTFLSDSSEALFSEHAFAVYSIVTQASGAKGVVAPCHDGSQGPKYGHNLDAFQERITPNTKIVFIANPNNPTGTFLGRESLYRFLLNLPDHCLAVIDEAYFEYVHNNDYSNAVEWLNELPNLIVTRTFSKAYGLAALRVGYAVSTPEIADLLNRVRQPFNTSSLAQEAARAALSDQNYLELSIAINNQGLKQLEQAFAQRGLEFIPSVGNFITFDVGRLATPVYEALLHEGVIVRPIANYGLPNHLRVTVGNQDQNRIFIQALDRVLGL